MRKLAIFAILPMLSGCVVGTVAKTAFDVATAAADGTIPTIGDGPPSIIATTIRTGHEGGTT